MTAASVSPFAQVNGSTALQRALARSIVSGEHPALIAIDLGFGEVNASYGEEVGDWALQVAKYRLAAAAVESILGRLDDDEFVVLLRGDPSPAEARLCAERLLDVVAAPMSVNGLELRLAARAGIAIRRGATAGELLALARGALVRAKRSAGAGEVCFCGPCAAGSADPQHGLPVVGVVPPEPARGRSSRGASYAEGRAKSGGATLR